MAEQQSPKLKVAGSIPAFAVKQGGPMIKKHVIVSNQLGNKIEIVTMILECDGCSLQVTLESNLGTNWLMRLDPEYDDYCYFHSQSCLEGYAEEQAQELIDEAFSVKRHQLTGNEQQ